MVPSGSRDIGWGVIGCGDVVDRKAGVALRTIPGSRIVTVMRRSALGEPAVIPASSPLVTSVCPSVTKPARLVKLSFINRLVKNSPGAIAATAVSR